MVTTATWWIFGKWYLGVLLSVSKPQALNLSSVLPGKAIILIQTRIAFLPMHFAKEKEDTPCRVCGGDVGYSFCCTSHISTTHACRPCSDHPTASPGSAWSMNWTPQGSSWWIWGQTRLPVTTHSMAATTLCSSASQRPRASCPPTQLPSSTWCRKGGWQEGMLRAGEQNLQDPNLSEPWLPSFRG